LLLITHIYIYIYIFFKKNLCSARSRGSIALRVVSLPVILGRPLHHDTLPPYLAQLADTGGVPVVPEGVRRELATRACHGAVRFGDPLTRAEVR
jgi:DNA mismatch repair protein MLH3